MKNKTFSKLKKGGTLWAFDNSEDEPLRELTIKKVDWLFIMKEDFEESVVISYSDWNHFEFGIIGTSKDAIKEKLCEMRDAHKRGIDYSFNDILYEFEK